MSLSTVTLFCHTLRFTLTLHNVNHAHNLFGHNVLSLCTVTLSSHLSFYTITLHY